QRVRSLLVPGEAAGSGLRLTPEITEIKLRRNHRQVERDFLRNWFRLRRSRYVEFEITLVFDHWHPRIHFFRVRKHSTPGVLEGCDSHCGDFCREAANRRIQASSRVGPA